MQATADQMGWVPIKDIVLPQEPAQEKEGDTVLLAWRGDGRYLLLSGRARLDLLKEQGRCYVDAVISPASELDERISQLVSDLMKGKLHYLEEAEAYRGFIRGDGLTTQELAQRTGRSVKTVQKKIRLLNLGEEVCALLKQHQMSERIAEELLRMPGQQGRMKVLTFVLQKGMNAKETETLIDDLLARMPLPMAGGRKMKPLMRDYRLYLNAIRGIVEQMQEAGLAAGMQVNTGRSAVDVRISVPFFTQQQR
ncbi:MAG: hypothetical protein PHI98_03545 [Eubacteriales bacterium]|nr:hypothetical protein [Eubacteriales bacterium]